MTTVEDAKLRMEEALDAMRREFASVRTGKATPALLDTPLPPGAEVFILTAMSGG